jgi:hypothetical protein
LDSKDFVAVQVPIFLCPSDPISNRGAVRRDIVAESAGYAKGLMGEISASTVKSTLDRNTNQFLLCGVTNYKGNSGANWGGSATNSWKTEASWFNPNVLLPTSDPL